MDGEIARAIAEKGEELGYDMEFYESGDYTGVLCDSWQEFAAAAVLYANRLGPNSNSDMHFILDAVSNAEVDSLGKSQRIIS